MATGAAPVAPAGSNLRDSVKGSTLGVGLGVAIAWSTIRSVQTQWSGIDQVSQPVLIVGGLLAMLHAAILSAVLPAWRATRVDPIIALRSQ